MSQRIDEDFAVGPGAEKSELLFAEAARRTGMRRYRSVRVKPLVEVGGDIVWVAGVRRGRRAPITAATTRVLELALEPAGGAPDPAVR